MIRGTGAMTNWRIENNLPGGTGREKECAKDLDGVKRRTRAGMGRCQGGFCSPRVTEIISRERGIPMTSVTKNGGCSYILNSKTR